MEQNKVTTTAADVKARLSALGFNKVKSIGLNILPITEGQTRIVKITSGIESFIKKDDTVMKYVEAVDLETGEEGKLWAGGQMVYQLEQMFDGFIGGAFAITYLGLVDVEGIKSGVHQYNILAVN